MISAKEGVESAIILVAIIAGPSIIFYFTSGFEFGIILIYISILLAGIIITYGFAGAVDQIEENTRKTQETMDTLTEQGDEEG